MTINEKINQLDEQIKWFYSDDFSLDKASENYKKAISLSKEIESDLSSLKNEIEVLSEDFSK